MQEVAAVVIEDGHFFTKGGWAGDDAPRAVFPSIIGRPSSRTKLGMGQKDCYVGDEAQSKRGILTLQKRATWTHADKERVFHYMFYNELRVAPEEHPIMLTQIPTTPLEEGEKLTQTMFETFNVPAFYISDDAPLAIYASGRTTGMVVDFGEQGCRAVPIYEGSGLTHNIQKNSVSGSLLTQRLNNLLTERGYSFVTSAEVELVRDMKEKFAFISNDLEADKATSLASSSLERSYELPSGGVYTLADERFMAPEALFDPSLLGSTHLPTEGVHQLIFDAIRLSPHCLRRGLIGHIVLAGGSSMFPGIVERLNTELSKNLNNLDCPHFAATAEKLGKDKSNLFSRLPAELRTHARSYVVTDHRIRVIAPPERKYSVWIGGSILASLSTFQQIWFSKEEYDEMGPKGIFKKCSV